VTSLPGEDLPLPVMVLKRSAFEHNLALMQAYCDERNVLLAPHGKTTMAPALFRAQMARGAWAITVANVQQLLVCRAAGVPRVVLANQVVGVPNLAVLARELDSDDAFELYQWVDSPAGVEGLVRAHALHRMRRPWQVLVEVGWPGGRTGARTDEEVAAVVDAVAASRGAVVLRGLAVFEALLDVPRLEARLAELPDPADDPIGPLLHGIVDLAEKLVADGALPEDYLLSGGGSTSFDKVAEVFGAVPAPARAVLRPGCYVAHDHAMYRLTSPLGDQFRPALELWSYVTSIPEPGLAYLGFGRRDVPFDHGLPVPLCHLRPGSTDRRPLPDAAVTELHDQHAALRYPGDELRIGDRVVVGISHPCGAFDRWRRIPVVDDDGVVIDTVETYF